MRKSRLTASEQLHQHIIGSGLPDPEREWRFHETRKWRFDYAYPEKKIAMEVEGGVFTGGRHTFGGGFEKDAEKYNSAALMGWLVLRFTPAMIRRGMAIDMIWKAWKKET